MRAVPAAAGINWPFKSWGAELRRRLLLLHPTADSSMTLLMTPADVDFLQDALQD